MDYLQYLEYNRQNIRQVLKVLNLIINGLPSIQMELLLYLHLLVDKF